MSHPNPILLVEDDPRDAELAIMALQEANVANEVIHLNDGQEALDFLRRQGAYQERETPRPIVVLLDIKLPKVSGLDALKQIKADPVLSSTPVVMLTSSREEADLVSSYDLGANGFVVKPFGFDELLQAIKGIARFWGTLNRTPENWV